LKKLAEAIGAEPFNFYSARHTWATVARNDLGIDKYTVNEALDHVDSGLRIADIYIKKDFAQINKANRRVIEYVFKRF
jgi:integrase